MYDVHILALPSSLGTVICAVEVSEGLSASPPREESLQMRVEVGLHATLMESDLSAQVSLGDSSSVVLSSGDCAAELCDSMLSAGVSSKVLFDWFIVN